MVKGIEDAEREGGMEAKERVRRVMQMIEVEVDMENDVDELRRIGKYQGMKSEASSSSVDERSSKGKIQGS